MEAKILFYRTAFAIAVIFLFSGCVQQWKFFITDASDYRYPEVCIVRGGLWTGLGRDLGQCWGDAVFFNPVTIYETNEKREKIEKMWSIGLTTSSRPIKGIKYGTVPEGYIEREPALPLELGKIYSIDSSYFFRFKEKAGKIEMEDWRSSSFYPEHLLKQLDTRAGKSDK
ncbi:MAG: hypothetical protein RBT82_14380 [Desulfomonilia bacterium]|nr:hypothetical protein [Desulfomonilia bacterium]